MKRLIGRLLRALRARHLVGADLEFLHVVRHKFRKGVGAGVVLGGKVFRKLPPGVRQKIRPEFLGVVAVVVGNDGEQLGDQLLKDHGARHQGIDDFLIGHFLVGHGDTPTVSTEAMFAVFQRFGETAA